MRLHTDYQLRNIGTFYFLVPLKSDHPVIDQILTLNETGAFLWNSLQKILQKQHTVQPKKATAYNAPHALQAVGGLIRTGATGTNVNDVAVALVE